MARTLRPRAEPHVSFQHQVSEAARLRDTAVHDDEHVYHDKAHSAFVTALNTFLHSNRCTRMAELYRATAAEAQAKRQLDVAATYNSMADDYQRAADFAISRAEFHRNKGSSHMQDGIKFRDALEKMNAEPAPEDTTIPMRRRRSSEDAEQVN